MNRVCLLVSAALSVFAIGCSRGAAPVSPSPAALASPAIAPAPSSSAAGLFGASAVDFGRCLQGAADVACLAAAHVNVRAVAGAAATAPGSPLNLRTSS